ncbi:hypothetical protein PORY_000243 [Pneumocystis oryctolagi]|uniref:Uncharacterized protein n=1 Tax=Pneumocystis oryctolagi TaxID=42067 RepID=A0ACB7CFU0_9ASCO|nr:hypothetical protein PORY_000243 [Pneumocystis oryctolagi]
MNRMSFFTFPRVRKKDSNIDDHDMLSELVDRLIFSAGVDDEGRPLVILNASKFPDSKDVNYDVLLERMLFVMDTFVDENDYSVVLFAGGVRHRPSWNWLFQAYQSLGRKYRKYIKVLYIVHSTWWIREADDSQMHHLVSPKFARKIVYVSTLSELAKLVPFRQINVPPDVYIHNLKYESHITLPDTMFSEGMPQMFGLSLSQVMGSEGENGLPKVVKDICAYIRDEALTVEGLFRRSPSSTLLKQVREAYDRGNPVTLSEYGPHLAAVLLKLYLRSLPEPLFTHNLYPLLRKISHQSSSTNISFIRNTLLPKLSTPAIMLLSSICLLLHDVSLHSKENLMHPRNLSICISPTLVRHPTDPFLDIQLCNLAGGLGMLMVIAIESTHDVFGFECPSNSESLQCETTQSTSECFVSNPSLDLIPASSSQVSSSPISSRVSSAVLEQSEKPPPELCTSNEVAASPKQGIVNESICLLASKPKSSNLTIRRQNLALLSGFSSVYRRSNTISVHEMSNSRLGSGIETFGSTKYAVKGSRSLKSKSGLVESLKNLYEEKSIILNTPKDFDVSKLQGKRVMI